MAPDIGLLDRDTARRVGLRVDLFSMIHRQAMTYRYDGDAGYARMFRLLGLPTEVPAFQPGRNYSGIAAGVLDAVVHNAALTTTTFSGSPEKLPLTTMSAEKFREMTAKEQLDA